MGVKREYNIFEMRQNFGFRWILITPALGNKTKIRIVSIYCRNVHGAKASRLTYTGVGVFTRKQCCKNARVNAA